MNNIIESTPVPSSIELRSRLVDKLRPEQAQFVWYIAEGLEPTIAYKKAYASTCKTEHSAYVGARRLLNDARICEAIGEIQESIFEQNVWYLRALQRKALKVLEDAISQGDVQAAQDLLDRTGMIPRRGLELATGQGRELDQFLEQGD